MDSDRQLTGGDHGAYAPITAWTAAPLPMPARDDDQIRLPKAGQSGNAMTMKNVFFSIPFSAKRDEARWAIACQLLGNTLASIFNQTDPAFEVVITGHERPSLTELSDPRVTFLKAPFPKPEALSEYHIDKRMKRRNNALYIKTRGSGYIVFLDADDLVSHNLIRHMRLADDPNGYVFVRGYLLDYRAMILGRCDNFDRHCGSCAAVYFSSDEISADGSGYAMSFYTKPAGHKSWRELAAAEGRPLQPIPFPAVVYVFNTSQNLSASLGEGMVTTRLMKIRRQEVPLTPDIIEEFSLSRVFPHSRT